MRDCCSRNLALPAISPIWLFLLLLLPVHPSRAVPQAQKEMLPHGVERWYVPESANGDSYFMQKLKEYFSVALPAKNAQPFGKSIAFLAGVSKYQYLSPQLPSVLNDIAAMRDFLLNKAGFDEVYVAIDDAVNRNLIEEYVKGTLQDRMQKNDRLLFYYSGHGGDARGTTGYMLFGGAKKGQFFGNDVLAVESLNEWSHELQIRHVLFILDSCSSGLGISPKSVNADSASLVLKSLSGNGSRTALTAGTADEATYAQDIRQKKGNSFFTKAFLNAFDNISLSRQKSGFITVTEIFADIERQMAVFRAEQGKSTTPRMWTLQEMDYRGTFVFLNPRAAGASLTAEQVEALGVKVVSKGEADGSTNPASGIIEVNAVNGGNLFLDGQDQGYMFPGQKQQIFRQSAGLHKVQVQGDEIKDVIVEGGKIAYVSFGVPSPIGRTGSVPVGSLEVRSTLKEPGDVYIDNYRVGHVEANGVITIASLIVGQHDLRVDAPDQSQKRLVVINANQTTRIILAPPHTLKVTAH